MKGTKRPKLPRGLRWRSNSPVIWFSGRDSRGKQHQQSTETANPSAVPTLHEEVAVERVVNPADSAALAVMLALTDLAIILNRGS